jgi:glyoxylase-like metal-dependent hydrolase (beta-lactamase superfamily II)
MKAQLAAIGYAPSDITYLALSHFHWDHTANANQFVKSTWLARQVERDAMLPETAGGPTTALDVCRSEERQDRP